MASATTTSANGPIPDDLRRGQRLGGIVGVAALAICAAVGLLGGEDTRRQFFQSYLMGYMLVLGASLGAMALLMLHHLTGGRWGVPIRRILEGMSRNIPLLTVLFIPIALGMHSLYEWTHADVVARDEVLKEKQAYLNTNFFLVRAGFYFLIWNVLSLLLNAWSLRLERTRDLAVARRLQVLSGPGILLYVLTMTFASFDWLMSLEPHWFSTIYGMLAVVGQALTAFAVVSLLLGRLARTRPLSEITNEGHFHDLGNLTFAFVMLWAYMSLSQFLIIWSGNIAEETPWYVTRTNRGWGYVPIILALLHFAAPFALLLSRKIKRNAQLLGRVAILILVMRVVDLFWLISPAVAKTHAHTDHVPFHMSFMDLLAPVGLAGIWLAAVVWQLGRRSLLPTMLPENGHGQVAAHGV